MRLEFFIALRYLRSSKKSRSVSFITNIAVVGVTIGVAADACPEKLSEIIKKIILAKKNHARLEKISHSYYKGGAAEKIYHSIYKYFENKNELVT